MSKNAVGRRNVLTHREGQTETLGAFLSPFKLFRINRFSCSSLPRGRFFALGRRVNAEALSPCLQLPFALQYGMSGPSEGGLDGCIHLEIAAASWTSCLQIWVAWVPRVGFRTERREPCASPAQGLPRQWDLQVSS